MPRNKGGVGNRKQKEEATRIAVVEPNRCKPKKCKLECKRQCPVNRQGKVCIEVKKSDKLAFISEILCIGCNICVKKCPFNAISIINLPKNLEASTTHRFGPNSFKLHRLPTPRANQVLGLVGTNGIGKSTALKILSGKLKPNLGNFDEEPRWEEILKYYRGNELQNYFTRILENDLQAVLKPQYVDHIPKKVKKGTVKKILKKKDERGIYKKIVKQLDLKHILNREIPQLSGGELQRFAIAACAIRDSDVYMFDEPSSYLDVKQRLKAGRVIRNIVSSEETHRRMIDQSENKKPKPAYVICVEHDLAILDYLSDFVCVLYGRPGIYGVVTMPFSVREGINHFLAGHIPTENMRFRDFELNFKVSDTSRTDDGDDEKDDKDNKDDKKNKKHSDDKQNKKNKNKNKNKNKKEKEKDDKSNKDEKLNRRRGGYNYPDMTKTLGTFKLEINGGKFFDSEIVVMLGENGTGKTTFVKMLAGILEPDNNAYIPELRVSYKPQKISPTFEGSVIELLHKRIRSSYMHPQFKTDVMKPLKMEDLFDRKVKTLSGGELQRVALALSLGTPADVYLIDEPSAYLDSEQRIIASKVIKRYILHAKKAAFVVEHDFIMATYLADRVIVFEGIPAKETKANRPQSLLIGMNKFLKQLDVTFRRDPNNFRPRINKSESQKDQEQKKSGNYFFLDAKD